jgi:hypothetical protein
MDPLQIVYNDCNCNLNDKMILVKKFIYLCTPSKVCFLDLSNGYSFKSFITLSCAP